MTILSILSNPIVIMVVLAVLVIQAFLWFCVPFYIQGIAGDIRKIQKAVEATTVKVRVKSGSNS